MVSARKNVYVGPDGEEVELTPHEFATQYKSRGYAVKREMSTEDISNPDVDSSEAEVPNVNAAIESDPLDLERARHGERRRDRLRD